MTTYTARSTAQNTARDLPTDMTVAALRLQASSPMRPPKDDERSGQKDRLRHILLGSPEEIRQAIHQLHVLHYAEPMLWSPIMAVGERLMITPEQGEAMSLLRR